MNENTNPFGGHSVRIAIAVHTVFASLFSNLNPGRDIKG